VVIMGATGVIAGMGEVGKALCAVLSPAHNIYTDDISYLHHVALPQQVDVLHICFPWSDKFMAAVREYEARCHPSYMVIHSTVPIGTADKLGAHHSPVRGNHPRLAESLRTFTTYLAPDAPFLCQYFEAAGMKVETVASARDTEAGKLFCLMSYAWSITLEKHIHQVCEEQALDFDVVYRQFTESYNAGYWDMGQGQLQRPVLEHKPGGIGGHCVAPACQRLAEGGDELAQLLLGWNTKWQRSSVSTSTPGPLDATHSAAKGQGGVHAH
jgi:hypothetical protein